MFSPVHSCHSDVKLEQSVELILMGMSYLHESSHPKEQDTIEVTGYQYLITVPEI